MEDQLQQAFENLQQRGLDASNRKQVEDLAIDSNENESCHSDGTSTKDKSNLGVPFKHSAPNSDLEQDPKSMAGLQKRRSKRIKPIGRKSTRTGKSYCSP